MKPNSESRMFTDDSPNLQVIIDFPGKMFQVLVFAAILTHDFNKDKRTPLTGEQKAINKKSILFQPNP